MMAGRLAGLPAAEQAEENEFDHGPQRGDGSADAGEWDESKVSRAANGQFGEGPWNPKKVAEDPDRDLGAKIDPEMGKAAVRAQMQEWAAKVRNEIRKDPAMHFGGWIDGGKLYLDVSRRYPESKEAEARAAGAPDRNNQIAIWHIGRGQPIPTGGTGEKTKR
jgi:hypothetical protein